MSVDLNTSSSMWQCSVCFHWFKGKSPRGNCCKECDDRITFIREQEMEK